MSFLEKSRFAGQTPCLWQKGERRKDSLRNRDPYSGVRSRLKCREFCALCPGERPLRIPDSREEWLLGASECSRQDGKHLRSLGPMTEDQAGSPFALRVVLPLYPVMDRSMFLLNSLLKP